MNNETKFFAQLTTIKVNVGTPGNVRPISLDGTKPWTVKEVLGLAELQSEGYDLRVNGQPTTADGPVTDGQTILLLAPVRGNLRTVPQAPASEAAASTETIITPTPSTIKVNVGTPGNVRPITLDGSKAWTVSEVLGLAEYGSAGYDLRVNGQPATGLSSVTDNQTILLLAPVRGN